MPIPKPPGPNLLVSNVLASRVHDNEVFDRSIDIQILRLRRKIEVDAVAPELIKTERGVGYIFSAPAEVV